LSDSVQPDEGQGHAAPYQEYLDRIPEETRGQVEPIFKEWDANTTRRFQEASEYRKTWEPYEKLGVSSQDPDAVAWALQFYNAQAENPRAIQEWYEQYAAQNNLTPQQVQEAVQQPAAQDWEYVDPSVQVLEDRLKQQLEPLTKQMEQLNSWREQQEQNYREQEALRMIEGQMADLKSKHPDVFNEAAVEKLIANYVETDPQHAVQRAFDDWQAIVSQIQRDTLQSKANSPSTPLQGGSLDGHAEPIRTLKEASRIALEQLRGANAAS
jgi:hypothetical protein